LSLFIWANVNSTRPKTTNNNELKSIAGLMCNPE